MNPTPDTIQASNGVTAVLRKPNKAAAMDALKVVVPTPVDGVTVESTIGAGPDLQNELLGGGTAPAPTETTSQAVTTRQDYAPPAQKGAFEDMSDGGFQGDFDSADIRFPTLKIVQGSGPLSARFSVGSVILGEEELLPAPLPNDKDPRKQAPELTFVPVSLKKQYRENISPEQYDAGQLPRTFGTIQEVEAVGGWTNWIGKEKPPFAVTARCLFLVQKPEGSDHPGFSFELDGKMYAPAVYYAAGAGWTRVAKVIFSAQTSLYVGVGPARKLVVPKYHWRWNTKKVQVNGNWIFAPEVKIITKEMSGPELLTFAKEAVGTPDSAVAAE